MTTVKIKRVYEPELAGDGFRVLADKLWPRGVRKEDLHYDLWAKDIAPSTPLRKWFHEDAAARWPSFRERYMQELETSAAVRALLDRIRREKTVTLLYASRNAVRNHALILQEFLQARLS